MYERPIRQIMPTGPLPAPRIDENYSSDKIYVCDTKCTVLRQCGGGFMMNEKDKLKKFELGKYYEHTTGKKIHICGVCDSLTYGKCLIAETRRGEFLGVSEDEGAAINWKEISKATFLDRNRRMSDERLSELMDWLSEEEEE